jgi:DNA-binding response OmpR family regulator
MKKRILVIDDDEGILDAFELILTEAGYNVKVFTKDGMQVQQNVKSFHPDLIILDVLLSGADGRILCKRLKMNPKTKQIPVIMISAHPSAEQTIKNCGANAFIAKPFEVDIMLNVINSFFIG